MNKKKVIFLVGPTGIGKSALALKIAKKINAEIISCDSMSVYKRMNILNAKPKKHHLIDILSPEKEYNVAAFRKASLKLIDGIIRKGKIPLFSGGSGLYVSAVLDGLFEGPGCSPSLRKKLYCTAQKKGKAYLYRRLKTIDPASAAKIHPNDLRRVVRALEVYQVARCPISQIKKLRHGIMDDYDVKIFGLNLCRDKLYKRIDQRVDKMFRQGVLGEVKKLLRCKLSKTASGAIGIKEIKGYLEGNYDLEEARRLMKRNSRRLAKRQLSWFRRDGRIEWLDAANGKDVLNRITRYAKFN